LTVRVLQLVARVAADCPLNAVHLVSKYSSHAVARPLTRRLDSDRNHATFVWLAYCSIYLHWLNVKQNSVGAQSTFASCLQMETIEEGINEVALDKTNVHWPTASSSLTRFTTSMRGLVSTQTLATEKRTYHNKGTNGHNKPHNRVLVAGQTHNLGRSCVRFCAILPLFIWGQL